MVNINIFLVTYDRLLDRVVNELDYDELNSIVCYGVQKKVQKNITQQVKRIINEWELPWNDYNYQSKQYYEYGSMVHLFKNPEILYDVTHVGIMHYDVKFKSNAINDIRLELEETPDTIFYQMMRPSNQLSLLKNEVDEICNFMSERLDMTIDSNRIWEDTWVSEALSVTPVDVFNKFANYLYTYHEDIEDILKSNRWNIMNHCPHRLCGLVERMWGFYLTSCNMPLKQMNVIHEWDAYPHQHMTMNGTGIATI
jgi:hypothetical protein